MKLFSGRHKKQSAAGMPVLQTERLVLREFEMSDAVDMFAYAKNPNVGNMAGFQAHKSIEDSRAVIAGFIERRDEWAIVEKRTGRVIGAIGLHKDNRRAISEARELGYSLGEESWGQGYGTEASLAVLSYAFDTLGVEIMSAGHFPFNQKSKKLIKKLGFVYEGTVRRAMRLPDGSVTDEAVYSMTKDEYEAHRAAREAKQCRR